MIDWDKLTKLEIFKLRFYLLATGLTGLEFVFILTFQRCEQEVVLYDAENGGEDRGRDGHQVAALHVTVDGRGGMRDVTVSPCVTG